jgi:hypothetical protein
LTHDPIPPIKKSPYCKNNRPRPIATNIADQQAANWFAPLTAASKGLPPPDELSGVGSEEEAAVVLDELGDAVVVGESDCWNVGIGVSSTAVGEERSEDVEVSESSVRVVEDVEVVDDEERTVVRVSADLVEVVREEVVVGGVVGLVLELDIDASGEVPGQTRATRLPNRTWPNTVAASTLAL